MAQSKVFIAFACLALVFVSCVKADDANEPESSAAQDSGSQSEEVSEEVNLTDRQLEAFKADIDNDISEKNMTCENREEICQEIEKHDIFGSPPSPDKSHCRIILETYLCEGPQNMDSIKRIFTKLKMLGLSMRLNYVEQNQ